MDLHREALPAPALAFDVRVAEAERLIEALLHEIHDRPVEQGQAGSVHENLHATILEDQVLRVHVVGIIDDVREPRAAGLPDAETQSHAMAAGGKEGSDP